MDAVREVLVDDSRVDYALVFGSRARGTAQTASDIDVAIGVAAHARVGALELGGLIAKLESASGHSVDIVLVDEAPSGLAYRIFRDGLLIVEKNHAAFVAHKTRAILEYLDFLPAETLATRGVLTAAADGR